MQVDTSRHILADVVQYIPYTSSPRNEPLSDHIPDERFRVRIFRFRLHFGFGFGFRFELEAELEYEK